MANQICAHCGAILDEWTDEHDHVWRDCRNCGQPPGRIAPVTLLVCGDRRWVGELPKVAAAG